MRTRLSDGLAPFVALVLALVLLLLSAAPSGGAKPSSEPVWSELQRSIDQPVEQQTPGGALQPDPGLWVLNPGPCFWDPDDRLEAMIYARHWVRGQTASHSECVYGDWAAHLWALNASTDFAVALAVDGLELGVGRGSTCILGPDYDHSDSRLEPVADSGGIALRHTVTWTVTAQRPLRGGVFVRVGLARSEYLAAWCPGPLRQIASSPSWWASP